ncbi:antitoxin [Streptosporangium sandarakinum]
MSGIGDWAKKAEDLAREHPDQADQVLDQGERFAGERTGHKYDEQIGEGVDAVQRRYGGGDAGPEADPRGGTEPVDPRGDAGPEARPQSGQGDTGPEGRVQGG